MFFILKHWIKINDWFYINIQNLWKAEYDFKAALRHLLKKCIESVASCVLQCFLTPPLGGAVCWWNTCRRLNDETSVFVSLDAFSSSLVSDVQVPHSCDHRSIRIQLLALRPQDRSGPEHQVSMRTTWRQTEPDPNQQLPQRYFSAAANEGPTDRRTNGRTDERTPGALKTSCCDKHLWVAMVMAPKNKQSHRWFAADTSGTAALPRVWSWAVRSDKNSKHKHK